MMRVTFCTRCGGNDLRNGQIRNADHIHFLLGAPGSNAAGGSGSSGGGMWPRRRGADIPLIAAMCMDCGHIEMRGDIHAARRLESNPDASDSSAADALRRVVD
jgi:hypothetical protein